MKKILLTIGAVLTAFGAAAQSYRGFFEIEGGIATGDKTTASYGSLSVPDIKGNVAIGFSTSHGVQITPWLFAGLGVGVNTVFIHAADSYQDGGGYDSSYDDSNTVGYGLNIPIFADLRWDLDITKKATPFVDIKIGYQTCVNFGESLFWATKDVYGRPEPNEYEDMDVYVDGVSGFYFQPTIGYRFRVGKRKGVNVGLTYNVSMKRKIFAAYSDSGYSAIEGGYGYGGKSIDFGKAASGAFMLNVGFDF